MAGPETGSPAEPPVKSDFSQPSGSVPPMANPYAATSANMGRPRNVAPHRGGLILTMGILALMCNCMAVPGILAWIMGKGDLKLMDAGVMDDEGRGITQAGMIMGIIGTCFVALGILAYIAYMLVIFFVIAAAAAGGGAGM